MRLFFSIVFSLCVCHIYAQQKSIQAQLQRIDSLIIYNQHDAANAQLDSLSTLLKNEYSGKEYLQQQAYLRLLQATIIDNKFEHSNALPIMLQVLDIATENDFYKLACMTNIRVSLNHEKVGNYVVSLDYLKEADRLCKQYSLDDLYSTICIRYSSLWRLVSSTQIDLNSPQRQELLERGMWICIDSAMAYAKMGIEYGKRYHKEVDVNDGYLLLGIIEQDPAKEALYHIQTINYAKKINDPTLAINYINISKAYIKAQDYQAALIYNDSAYLYYNIISPYYKHCIPKNRSDVYTCLHMVDSAFYYYKIYTEDYVAKLNMQEQLEVNKLEEHYQNERKAEQLKSKNRLIFFIVLLLIIVLAATLLLIKSNRKIGSQNKIINRQLAELVRNLEQKQVLLSELQHRVKNNLQHVISILDIQRESIDLNNIDEVVKASQNRIHSMALLHKKLNVAETVNEVNMHTYITELSELVKESYANSKHIVLTITCSIDKMQIEKALPLGLIIVELVSNSMKYAFKKADRGAIHVNLQQHTTTGKYMLQYSDTGPGFQFDKTNNGLGLQIVKGLIDQLNASIQANNAGGFGLSIVF
jgi:two-component sensor histidine kinase